MCYSFSKLMDHSLLKVVLRWVKSILIFAQQVVYSPHSVMWPGCGCCPLVETGDSLAYKLLVIVKIGSTTNCDISS